MRAKTALFLILGGVLVLAGLALAHSFLGGDDAQDVAAAPAEPEAPEDWWEPRQPADIPAGPAGDQIRYGLELLSNTSALIGPDAADPADRLAGNTLSCTNCHQNGGTKRFGLSFVGVANRYPSFRRRSGRTGTITDRINGCMLRSMNGRTMAPESPQMLAMIAYMNWLSEDVPADIVGAQGSPPFTPPDRRADIVAGETGFEAYCASCHGSDGAGAGPASQGLDGSVIAPAVWGDNSYNEGAGMNRLLTISAFLIANMPLGTTYDHPVLSTDQAYDIAAYVNSHPRPAMAGLDRDYPDRTLKPVDAPFGPYADDFSQDQHRYGPYAPITAAIEAMRAEGQAE